MATSIVSPNSALLNHFRKMLNVDDVDVIDDPLRAMNIWQLRRGSQAVSVAVALGANPTTTLQRAANRLNASQSLTSFIPGANPYAMSPLATYHDQNELDVRWNNIESLSDIPTLRSRFIEQHGHDPKQIVVTPEQNDVLAADTTGMAATSVKMDAMFGMKIYVRERNK